MPGEAPIDVQTAVAPHLVSAGIPESLAPTIFQALAAAGYTVQGEEASEPAEIVDTVPCDRRQIVGTPGAFLVSVTDGDVVLRWIEWHSKSGEITRSNVTAVVAS